jgi:hypothetical protein
VVLKIVWAPAKAGRRVEGALRSAVTREMPFEAQDCAVAEVGLRVRPRTVQSGRVEKRDATDPPW